MMDRNLGMEAVRITEAAALHAGRLVGRGDEENAHAAALRGMEKAMQGLSFDGRMVIGDEEDSGQLATGAVFGNPDSPDAVDLAVKALEGTTPCATGGPNAISFLAIAERGTLKSVPRVYMEKMAVGPEAVGAVSLSFSIEENLKRLAEARARYVEDLAVVILDRPRNERYISAVRKVGARIFLIGDGDVSGAMATAMLGTGVDMLLGIGGAPEGVLAAVGLKCLRGDFQGRFIVQDRDDQALLRDHGLNDIDRIWSRDDLASGLVMFAATGITDGELLRGVRFESGGARSHSMTARSKSGTVRLIESVHHFDLQPVY